MTDDAWRLVVAGPAARHIAQLPQKYAAAILELLPALADNPHRLGKPLRFELEGLWSARRGPYRVIYAIDEPQCVVKVVAVQHRADLYRPR